MLSHCISVCITVSLSLSLWPWWCWCVCVCVCVSEFVGSRRKLLKRKNKTKQKLPHSLYLWMMKSFLFSIHFFFLSSAHDRARHFFCFPISFCLVVVVVVVVFAFSLLYTKEWQQQSHYYVMLLFQRIKWTNEWNKKEKKLIALFLISIIIIIRNFRQFN